MIDLHSHVLPGLDDGPRTLPESLELLRAAADEGIAAIAATPHVRHDHPTTPEQMEALLGEVRAAAADIPIEVLGGGELSLEMAASLDDAALRRFGLGGNPRVLLLETPYTGWPLELPELAFVLATRGFTVVLAHPERNPEVQERPELLEPLVERGLLVQVTAASLDGRLGSRPRVAALQLLERGTAHLLASDAHAPSVRAVGMRTAAEAVGDAALARWLTVDVPSALVDSRAVPERPARRRRWRR